MKKTLFFLLSFLILISSLVVAGDVIIQRSLGDDVLEIRGPIMSAVKIYRDYEFNFHIFNKSLGFIRIDVNCTFHLHNDTGNLIMSLNNILPTHFDYDFLVDGSTNFTHEGQYQYTMWCEAPLEQGELSPRMGGFVSHRFDVTAEGYERPAEDMEEEQKVRLSTFLVMFGIALIFIAFMHVFQDDVGSSITYGTIAFTLLIILGSMIFFGFEVIVSLIGFPFNVNTILGLMCYLIGIYAIWYASALLLFGRKKKKKEDLESDFKPR